MRKILLLFTTCCFWFGTSCKSENDPSNQEGETEQIDSNYCHCDELIFDGSYNHYYRFKKREGFTGTCESFYPSGQLEVTKHFDDGKLEGEMIRYFESGQVAEKMEFMTNFQTGFQTNFNESGDTVYHAFFKRGNLMEVYIQ